MYITGHSPDLLTATGQVQVRTLPPGVHPVNLALITTDGCASDTTKNITVLDKPPADFQVAPGNLCVGQAFTITDTASAAIAVTEWYWDFGNGVTQVVTTGPSVTYTYPAYGTYMIKHVARSSVSCVSDTVSRTVTVYAKPTVSFTNDANGCISPSGLVQFTGNAAAADGQAIVLMHGYSMIPMPHHPTRIQAQHKTHRIFSSRELIIFGSPPLRPMDV